MDKTEYFVRAIPSSFVFSDMKLFADKGAGEAKLFVGPKSKETEIDEFFKFGSGLKYRFDKNNMLDYLLQVKMEFVFQTINQYKDANIDKWNQMFSAINNLADFTINLEKFTDDSRYYVRSDDELFKKTFRKIVVPKLTDLQFVKYDEANEIVLYLNVNYEYNRVRTDAEEVTKLTFETDICPKYKRNRILFGAPGTSKSFTLNREKAELLEADSETDYERVTFHPDYSYANFVGTYKPTMVKNESTSDFDDDKKKDIAYEYVPGPFMRVLVKALKSALSGNPKPYLLIIEEINRANVAAVFGDVFQLLDRDKKNISEYAISTTNDMRTYLAEQLNVDESAVETIKIPDNMFIWATMNSADQGVFPMDTAFKRRWDFTYLGIDDAVKTYSEKILTKKYVLGTGEYARLVGWNDLREAINNLLSSETFNINEDKLLGPYFISKAILESDDDTDFTDVFKNKVLMYLFDDAVKQKKKTFFEECRDAEKGVRYSDICKLFDTKGVFIFPENISKRFSDKPKEQKAEADS